MEKKRKAYGIVTKELEDREIDYDITTTKGGHTAIVFRHGDREHKVFCPSTSSDRRSKLNLRSTVRNILRKRTA